ncbi:MAG: hypothetical protein JMN24_13660 [gamma proteobacterium endosymbiont of Lamellibrachia anaximandri]|nr:hypothetical protein [gamma proteobacterium endosymbiont of Lamellibrachia anaximandri]MBL3618318.1 hypothetical protein [gamma proteobacterium endosymbiont of Lamellibrachia anaximandri]
MPSRRRFLGVLGGMLAGVMTFPWTTRRALKEKAAMREADYYRSRGLDE